MSSPTLTIAVMSGGRDDADEPGEHSSGPDAAAQGHQHVASIGAPGRRAVPAAPGTIAARHASAHPLGSARDRGVGPAGGGTGQRRRRGVRRARRPGRPRRALTFAAWDRAADGVAGHLARLGVAKGDVVCLLLPSCIDYAVLYAALLRLGAITSGINPRMGAGEVASILDRAAPVLLVVDPERRRRLPTPGRRTWSPAPRPGRWWAEEGPDAWPELASSDPVAVVWTSGTTGQPKGALFDHANLAAVARGTDVLSQPGDRRLSPLPFAHVGYMTRAWDEIGNARDDRSSRPRRGGPTTPSASWRTRR